ncbi:MAG: hypothetical protein J5662_08910, partial [Clostridia bacterium]|nr:hypothetical protein [Clostridia bacterium]
MNLKGYVSKLKKPVSAVLSVVMIFVMFAVLTVSAPMSVSATTATEKAIFIGSADSIAGAFIPMDITTDGTNNPTGTHYYKLSFKCKMLKNGNSDYQPSLPSIGIMSTYTGTAERTTTCPSWAGDYDSNTAATLTNGVYSMRFRVNYDSCARRDDAQDSNGNNGAGYRTFYITVGNAAHRADSWASYRNFGCSFIFSGVELYECNSDGSNVQTTNLIPQINSDNIDFNGTYYERTDGANQWDSPFGSAAMKWHVLDRNDVVRA